MGTWIILLLTIVIVYFGVALQAMCDLLLDKSLRQANSGWRLLLMLAKCLAWPLILLDAVHVDGLLTRAETKTYNAEVAEAAAPVSAGFREVQQAKMADLGQSVDRAEKKRAKRRQRKRKKKH